MKRGIQQMTQLEYDTEYAALVADAQNAEDSVFRVYPAGSNMLEQALELIERKFERAVDRLDKRFMQEDA
jgi:hypothetical protein